MFVFKESFQFKLGCRMQKVPENPEKSSCGSYILAGMFQKVKLDFLRLIFSQAGGPVQCLVMIMVLMKIYSQVNS